MIQVIKQTDYSSQYEEEESGHSRGQFLYCSSFSNLTDNAKNARSSESDTVRIQNWNMNIGPMMDKSMINPLIF